MKLICLNTWAGQAGLDKLLVFLTAHGDVDIFCFQEIWSGGEHLLEDPRYKLTFGNPTTQLLTAIQGILPDHVSYFRPHFFQVYGLAIFVKRRLVVFEEDDLFVYKERSDAQLQQHDSNCARNIQYVSVGTSLGPRVVINFHGLWNGGGKHDCDERLKQSERIARFIATLRDPFVLCGDFNLLPDTESLAKLESLGLRNLIKSHRINSTRTSLYAKPHRIADYVLVSKGISVRDFRVLPDEVSDHNALQLEFE